MTHRVAENPARMIAGGVFYRRKTTIPEAKKLAADHGYAIIRTILI
jgi:hypothetical protein